MVGECAVLFRVGGHVKRCVMEDYLVASATFRQHERIIGPLERSLELLSRLCVSDAKAGGKFWQSSDGHRGVEAGAHAFERVGSVSRRTSWKGQGELLAAVARHKVIGAHRVAQNAGKESQRAVTGLVPIGVVEGLEVVEVDHGYGYRVELIWHRGDLF